jgi:hypothetical protein
LERADQIFHALAFDDSKPAITVADAVVASFDSRVLDRDVASRESE